MFGKSRVKRQYEKNSRQVRTYLVNRARFWEKQGWSNKGAWRRAWRDLRSEMR